MIRNLNDTLKTINGDEKMDYKMRFYLDVISLNEKFDIIDVRDNSLLITENQNEVNLSLKINEKVYIFGIKFDLVEQIRMVYINYCYKNMDSKQFYNILFKLTGKEISNNYFDKGYFDYFIIKIMKDFYFNKIISQLKNSIEFKFESLKIESNLILLETELQQKKRNIKLELYKSYECDLNIKTFQKEDEHYFKRWAINRMNYYLDDKEKPFLKFVLKDSGDKFIASIVGFIIIESFKKSKLYKLNCLYNPELEKQINAL
jgi:hypothetical protein